MVPIPALSISGAGGFSVRPPGVGAAPAGVQHLNSKFLIPLNDHWSRVAVAVAVASLHKSLLWLHCF